jgi:transketolase
MKDFPEQFLVMNKQSQLFMSQNTIEFSRKVRILSLKMVFNAKASHIGGALSMADILSVLYNKILRLDPSNPKNPERDRFLLSKGHSCTSLYATLALKGFFPIENLDEYAKDGSIYLSHTNHVIPGVEFSTGSLGHALPVSCGLALAAKRKKMKWKTFCLISDGELDEGSNWEAMLFAQQLKLDNLVLIVDYNKIQSLGSVKEVIDLHPLDDKLRAFNWETYVVDGHNHKYLEEVFMKLNYGNGSPKAIIAHTIKGKGVSFMEDQLLWHYKSPTEEQLNDAMIELNKK